LGDIMVGNIGDVGQPQCYMWFFSFFYKIFLLFCALVTL